MYDHRFLTLYVSPEEDRCSKRTAGKPLRDVGTTFRPVASEGVEHFRRAAEPNRPILLPNGKRGEQDRNEPILSPRQSIGGMSGHLKQKMTVASFVQDLSRLRTQAIASACRSFCFENSQVRDILLEHVATPSKPA